MKEKWFPGARFASRYDLVDDFVIVGISFVDLTAANLQVLEDVTIAGTKANCEELLRACETPLYELSILTKCNAVFVVAVALHPTPAPALQASILESWSRLTNGKLLAHRAIVRSFAGLDALLYLHEVSVGLHSVTLGDSQVFNQTRHALTDVCYKVGDISLLNKVVSSLRYTRQRVDAETKLFRGNISLERIACGIVEAAYAPGSAIAIIGSGLSASLLAEILTTELSMVVTVAGRNEKSLGALRAKYPMLRTCPLDDWQVILASGAVIVALDVNPETSEYVRRLYGELERAGVMPSLVIDLSSPGFACRPAGQITFYGIEELSTKADAVNKMRAGEVSAAREIISGQMPVAAEMLRMENLNRYLGSLDMIEVRGQQELYRRASGAWKIGACLIGVSVTTAGAGAVPKWIPFLSGHEIVIPIWIWLVIGASGILSCAIGSFLNTKLWAMRLLEGYRNAHVRKLVPVPIDKQCLDNIRALGSATTGDDTFVLRSTLGWLSKHTPGSVRAWTIDGQGGDIRCFYVVAPLSKAGVERMLSRQLKKNRDLQQSDVCRTFARASGMYVIEVWGADDRAKAAILAALKIDSTEHLLHSRIGYLFSRPVNEFGQRQLEKTHFQRLGIGDREMWVKRLAQIVPV